MRTGEIFARGSCRALKWMAMFGVVFALGAGSAAAQVTIKGPTMDTVTEGEVAVYTVTVKGFIEPDGDTGGDEVTVTVVPDGAGNADATEGEDGDLSANLGLTFSVDVPDGPAPGDGVVGVSFNSSGTIRVPTNDDVDAEDERFGLTWTVDVGGLNTTNVASGGTAIIEAAGSPAALIIDDDEDQEYVLALHPATRKPSEGDPVTARLTAKPEHTTQGSGLVTLHLDQTPPFSIAIAGDDANAITGNSVSIGGGGDDEDFATITITTDPNDENRSDDTITLTAYSGTAGNAEVQDTLEIKLTDANKLPAVTAKAIMLDADGKALENQPEDGVMSIMEGQMIDVEITVVDEDGDAMAAGEALMVSLMPTGDANSQDYRLNMHPVAVKSGDKTGTARLTAVEDQDIGMETLAFDADVAGEAKNGSETRMSMGVLSVAIMDTTMKAVEAVSDEMIQEVVYAAKEAGAGDDMMFSPGEMIEVDASMLFTAAEGYSLTYAAMSDNAMAASASAGGNMVTVTAMEPGMGVHITVTATATAMMSGAKGLPQTSPNVAQVVFPVDVELADLMVTLSGPEDMNVAEGMSAMITAMANRPVVGDTMVELIATEGTASPADYMVEPLMIMDGMMEGTTMLMAVADEMMEDMEMLTLEGRVGDMKTNTVMFYLWDAAVPALPLIAQLLLAAFLAIGGYRRYLRR